ncbi:Cytosolic carboxypeptidase 1 [Phytophthora citrophthora]|uniref:Cytosolic carboxypeptidase 1 n=1 Tax=Phytophthora citrophthora TaxID=4793 RepID=A0AAD9GQG5_9STRA|nr:Cytosolic carboxypeptidase 1 [Phytophthora citrophthora]
MQGMLDYLTGPSTGAVILRRNFIFKVVPMLNPDGVINGNTRVGLAGWDLNRKWSNPIEQLFPTVYHLKQQLAHFQAHGRVAIYCDLHGHSINRNIFTYGCYTSKKKADTSNPTVKTDPRVFPMIVARHAPCFSFSSCDFSVHKSKLTTARVVVNQELGVTNSYTLEASFCGPDFGVHKDTQFSTWDLEEMGRSWCQSLLVYYGLTRQVKALEAERETLSTQSIGVELCPTESQVEAEDEASGLLLDCEAAISALFTHSAIDTKDDAIDSDLSGAEEEPIPPSPEEISPDSHSEWKKQGDEGGGDGEGYSSAPDTAPTCSNHTSKVKSHRKKTGRRKRGSVVSKPKSSCPPTSRKTDTKPKKKKHKGKAELRPTSSTKRVVTPSLGSKPEDTSVTTALEPAGFILVQPPKDNSGSVPSTTPKEKRAATARRSKSISSRPKLSRDIPRSITSAILQATMNADTRRLRSMTEYQRTPSATLLVLPSVLGGSFRGTNAVPRILKTAPAYNDQENSAREDKSRFNLSRMRSELPVLVHSSRDEEQQRLSRRSSRGQENDDVRSEASSDERSEPEAYGSSF